MDGSPKPRSASGGPRIAVRVDASVQMGTGHLRRCITLAEALVRGGFEVTFVTRDLGIDNRAPLAAAQLAAIALPAPDASFVAGIGLPHHAAWAEIDWETDAAQTVAALRAFEPTILVIDHYAFDSRWHEAVADGLRSEEHT